MRALRAAALVASFAVTVVIATTCSRDSDTSRATGPGQGPGATRPRAEVLAEADPVVVAAGDAVCGTGTPTGLPCKHVDVASVISASGASAVLLLGDNQYENGTLSDYNTYYQPSWGAFKDITWPAPGNHEYNTAGASGYYDYFNGIGVQAGRAGDRAKGYYSVNMGAWHVVALNSNCAAVGGCAAGSPQELWLRGDLAANTNTCTLAYWHHPRFSSGGHGNDATMQPLWQALYDLGADVVLNGHDHDYERFARQTPGGGSDNARGVRQFVVGTGGKEHGTWGTIRANSELRDNTSFGVLRLTLHADSYDWQFLPIVGNTLSDAGTTTCSAAVPPPPPPTQTTLTIPASADTYVFKDKPNGNYGTAPTLLVDGSPLARSYFKFAVTGIGSRSVVSAKVRVYVVDPSDAGGRLHRVLNSSWNETKVKWANAPTFESAVLGTIGAVVSGTWYEVDVSGQVTADGTVSFALESSSANGADYASREGGSATAPRLIVVVQ